MRPSAAEKALAAVGVLLAGLGARALLRLPGPDGPELARLYQHGFGASVQALAQAPGVSPAQREELAKRWLRARTLARHDPEDLRATPPFILRDDGRFWPKSSDVHPTGSMVVSGQGASRQLRISPYGGAPWSVPLRSAFQVAPDWSPVSGLVAYFDLGRIWIADVAGRKYQSLASVPELEQGGELRFSADGNSLAFQPRHGGAWKAVDFYALRLR